MTWDARRLLIGAAFLFLSAVYLVSQWRDFDRGPSVDEVEHLHVAVLMERGQRVFVDFAEHHPPLFWGMLRPLVPSSEGVPATEGVAAMQTLLVRARLLSSFFTVLAILSAAWIVFRASANGWSAVTFAGLVFAAGGMWRNGLGDVRPDAAALGFWWVGAALVLLAPRPTLKGLGIGLVFVAALVKPQWPVSSIVIGVVFLLGVRGSFLRASLVAVAVAAAGIGATAAFADPGAVWFHVITLSSKIYELFFPPSGYAPPFYACPRILRPAGVGLAALVILGALVPRQALVRRPEPRLTVTLLLLAAASLCEIVFLYPWPFVDFRLYAFWVFAAAAVLALLPQSAAELLRMKHLPARHLPAGAGVFALLLSLDLIGPARPGLAPYWRSANWVAARLAPGETVWNGWTRHPIDAHDASYYWFKELIPASLHLLQTEAGRRHLPPFTEADLPPCRIERGLDRNVRFIGETFHAMPVARACFQRLRERGLITRSPFGELWMVRR